MVIPTRGFIKIIVHAEHRNGICVECGVKMQLREIMVNDKSVKRAVCPECGGTKGQLIARPISIQAPDSPQCLSPKCLARFMYNSLFVAFLSSYHRRRVAYAEKNRPENKTILERYRTGQNTPTSFIGAIVANLKLACPLCRKINTKW